MAKKLFSTVVSVFLSLVLMLTFAACGPEEEPVGPGGDPTPSESQPPPTEDPEPTYELAEDIDRWVVSSYENVFKDAALTDNAAQSAEWVVAKNEYEAVQILVKSPTAFQIKGITFTDLKSGGNRIDKGNLKYNFVEHAFFTENSPNLGEENAVRWGADYYPDALSNETQMDVAANECQPVWVTLYVPKDAAPACTREKPRLKPIGVMF